MADKWAVSDGNWSTSSIWNDGIKPSLNDDVYAENKIIYIDEDISVASLRTTTRSGGTASTNGKGFFCNTTRNITISGALWPANNATVLKLLSGSSVTLSCQEVKNSSTSGERYPTLWLTGGTLNLTVSTPLTRNSSTLQTPLNIYDGNTSLILNGNIAAGGLVLRNDNYYITTPTTITINGDVGTDAIYQKDWTNNMLTFIINGKLSGKTAIRMSTIIDFLLILNGTLECDSLGFFPVAFSNTNHWKFLIHPSSELSHTYRVNSSGSAGAARSLYTGGVNLNQPIPADVRYGTVYGASNEYTGTCRIPSANTVLLGNLVDNTTGTLDLDIPTLTEIEDVVIDAISSVITLDGSESVSVNIIDSDSNAVTNYRFTVLNSSKNKIGDISTDTLGSASFSLNNGNYYLRFPLSHIYEDHADVSFTVSGTTTVPTITLTRNVLSGSVDPTKSNVYFVLYDVNGPIQNGSIEYTLDKNCFAEDIELSSRTRTVYTDSTGTAVASMFRYSTITKGSGIYKIIIRDQDGVIIHDVRRRIKTDQSAVYFEDLHD